MPASVPAARASTGPVRIIVADQHPIFRDGLRRMLEARARLRVVGETGDESEIAGLVRDQQPDILLLGLSSARLASAEILQGLAASVRTMILTASTDTPQVANAVRLGAVAVIPKDSTAEMLFRGIDSVMEGHGWIGDRPVTDVAASLRRLSVVRRRSKAFGLTRRELDVLQAVVNGSSNKDIGRQFSISESTVKRHLAHVFDKLGVSSRVEGALFATHHRVFEGV